jgi:hypothetical protein
VKSANTAIAPSIDGFAASYAARTRLVAASTLRTFGGSGAEADAVHLTPPEATCSLSAVEAALGTDCGVDLRRAKIGSVKIANREFRRCRFGGHRSLTRPRRWSLTEGRVRGRPVAARGPVAVPAVPLTNGPQTRPEAVARIQRRLAKTKMAVAKSRPDWLLDYGEPRSGGRPRAAMPFPSDKPRRTRR